mgnify:CR=1 FL=1
MITKKDIISKIEKLGGAYSPYMIFRDWVTCLALATANTSTLNHDKIWEEREREYKDIMQKYPKDIQNTFPELTGMLIDLYGSGFDDFLGDIFMKSGCGSSVTGQFFTPFHLSVLMAEMAVPEEVSEKCIYELNEPTCGGGASIIAAAQVMKERGINYQKCMKVVAQDLDWTAVYMTYIACSFYGIDAIVVQGVSLADPYHKGYPEERIFRTPRNRGCLIDGGKGEY